jgi:hypothetical protein
MKKILLPLFLAATICSSAQKVSNKLIFQNGQKLEVTTNMNMTTESMMGESTGNVINIDEYAIANSSAEETTIQKAAKKMKLSFSLMGKDYTIDSDNKADMEGQFGEPIKKIIEQKYEFTIDGSGKIIRVKTDEKKKKNDDASGMMGMMMPGMDAAAALPIAGNPSVFKFLPDGREVAQGDTWTDSINTADNQTRTTYVAKGITDSEILLDFTQDGTTKTSQSAMGMNIDATATSKTTGTVTLDRASGIIKQRTATTNTQSTMNLGGREMNSTLKMTTVTTVKTL